MHPIRPVSPPPVPIAHAGNFTVFNSGVYTACEPCKDDPKKPPFWQVKAARIIHNEGEKMIYFENARLEFMGVPTMYMPYFSAPDPTVKRKTGWLMPIVSHSSKYGFAVKAPYYWALAPDRDMTVSPMIMSRQGPLMEAEYRQRLETGSFMVRGSGMYQLDQGSTFIRDDGTATPGYTNWRGSLGDVGPVRALGEMGLGLGRRRAFGQDLFSGLQSLHLSQQYRSARNRPDRGRLAALSHRQGRSQLLSMSAASTTTVSPKRITSASFPSSIR